MSKISKVLASVGMVFALAIGLASFAPMSNVSAACDPKDPDCISGGSDAGACTAAGGEWTGEKCIPDEDSQMASQLFGTDGIVTRIISVVTFIIGALCVVMLLYGGIQYILSAGDSGKVTSAKNTILYAVIGLIVCIVAFAIVQFILKNIKG